MLDPGLAAYLDSEDLGMGNSGHGGGEEYYAGSVGTPASLGNAGMPPVYFDLWATMTGSWAEEF